MSDSDEDVFILSESDDQSDFGLDSEQLLRHSHDVQSRDLSGLNLRAFPIASSGTFQEVSKPEVRLSDRQSTTPALPDFERSRDEGWRTTTSRPEADGSSSDEEETVLFNYERDHPGYKPCHELFQDPNDREVNRKLKKCKRDAVLNLILLGTMAVLSGVGSVFYFPDIYLLNVGDVTQQWLCYLTAVVLSVPSSFLSLAVVDAVGYRASFLVGCLGASSFVVARFFSVTWLLVTSSVIAGLTSGPLAIALAACMIDVSRDYAAVTSLHARTVIVCFSAFLNLCHLLSASVSAGLRMVFLDSPSRASFRHGGDPNSSCFRHFCWSRDLGLAVYEVKNQRSASDQFLLQTVLGCFLTCSLGGVLLSGLRATSRLSAVDGDDDDDVIGSCSRDCLRDWARDSMPDFKRCRSSVREMTSLLCDNFMLLIALLCIYQGVGQTFMYDIFLQSYTECGSQMFGALALALNLSLVTALCSVPAACIMARFGRFKAITPALATQLVLLAVVAGSGQLDTKAHYVVATFWAASDAVLQSGLTVVLAEVFDERAKPAVVCQRVCQLLGYLVAAVFQLCHLCNYVIAILVICLLLVSTLCYCILEIRTRILGEDSPPPQTQYVPLLDESSWLPQVNPVLVRRQARQVLSPTIPTFSPD